MSDRTPSLSAWWLRGEGSPYRPDAGHTSFGRMLAPYVLVRLADDTDLRLLTQTLALGVPEARVRRLDLEPVSDDMNSATAWVAAIAGVEAAAGRGVWASLSDVPADKGADVVALLARLNAQTWAGV